MVIFRLDDAQYVFRAKIAKASRIRPRHRQTEKNHEREAL